MTAFVRRFRLLERKLQDSKIPLYPEQARVVKLLDGLRLDERATSALLLAAGNRYHMQSILESIRTQYPAGMSITGVPKGLATLSTRTSRPASSRSASSARSSGTSGSRRSRVSRWTHWQTEWDDQIPEEDDEEAEWEAEYDQSDDLPEDEPDGADEGDDLDEEEELVRDQGDQSENLEIESGDAKAFLAAVQALTVTSKKLAGLAQSRGYYQVDSNKGKGKGKGKGKQRSKGSSGKGKGASKGPSKGKSKTGTGKSIGLADKQARLRGSLCLGCGSADHWIKDCPRVSSFQGSVGLH